jgi:hypothetical protein
MCQLKLTLFKDDKYGVFPRLMVSENADTKALYPTSWLSRLRKEVKWNSRSNQISINRYVRPWFHM